MAMRRKALLLLVAHALLIVGGGRPGVTQFDRYLEKHGLPRPCLILYHVGKAGGETLHQWCSFRAALAKHNVDDTIYINTHIYILILA